METRPKAPPKAWKARATLLATTTRKGRERFGKQKNKKFRFNCHARPQSFGDPPQCARHLAAFHILNGTLLMFVHDLVTPIKGNLSQFTLATSSSYPSNRNKPQPGAPTESVPDALPLFRSFTPGVDPLKNPRAEVGQTDHCHPAAAGVCRRRSRFVPPPPGHRQRRSRSGSPSSAAPPAGGSSS